MDEADKVCEQKKFDSITIQKWLNEVKVMDEI